jgi:hypothetical protein
MEKQLIIQSINSGFQGNGFQGIRGLQGFQGVNTSNRQGLQGATGAQGFSGISIGLQGNQGFQAFDGNIGTFGLQGNQGNQGFQGFQGFQANSGIIGLQSTIRGFQGLQGTQGNQGFQGFQVLGFQGSLYGIQGEQGVQGGQGFQNRIGFNSHLGVLGFQNINGNQGSQGTRGFQGLNGIQGISENTRLWSLVLQSSYYYILGDSQFSVANTETLLRFPLSSIANVPVRGMTVLNNNIFVFTLPGYYLFDVTFSPRINVTGVGTLYLFTSYYGGINTSSPNSIFGKTSLSVFGGASTVHFTTSYMFDFSNLETETTVMIYYRTSWGGLTINAQNCTITRTWYE